MAAASTTSLKAERWYPYAVGVKHHAYGPRRGWVINQNRLVAWPRAYSLHHQPPFIPLLVPPRKAARGKLFSADEAMWALREGLQLPGTRIRRIRHS